MGLCLDPPADDAVMCVTVGDEIEAVSGNGDDEVDDRGTDGGGTDNGGAGAVGKEGSESVSDVLWL